MGSAISLTIFLLVGIAGYRRRADTRSSGAIVLAAIALTATVLVFFAVDTLRNEPETFTAIVAILLMSVVVDLAWTRVRGEAVPQEVAEGCARTGDTPVRALARRERGMRL